MINFIDIGHCRIAYRTVGTGPDVVFVHGWPLHSQTYRHIVPIMEKYFTCHLIDLPGTGGTVWDRDTPIGLRSHCDTLRRIVDGLGLERYAFVAHDSGGIFSRHVAAADGERVAGLVLGNTDLPDHRPLLLRLYLTVLSLPGGTSILPLLLRSSWIRHSWLFGGSCFHQTDFVDGEFYDLFVAPLFTDRYKLQSQLRLLLDWDWAVIDSLSDVHGKLRAPVQLIWGAADPVFPLSKARQMVAQFTAGAELQIIDQAKLFAHEEYPHEFAEHAVRFLKNCFAGGGTLTP